MSDDFHRPTLTFPDEIYSATQVRLYGKSAGTGLIYPGKSKTTPQQERECECE